MNKQEALLDFEEVAVTPLRERMQAELEEEYQQRGEAHAAAWASSFERICLAAEEARRAGGDEPVAYITYSLLRTELAAKRPLYRVEAAGSGWFMQSALYEDCYDAGWAFRYLDRYEQALLEASGPYSGRIGRSEIALYRQREAVYAHAYVMAVARLAMKDAALTPAFRALTSAEQLEVRVGEYRDFSEVVYKRDDRAKDVSLIRSELEHNGSQAIYAYEVLAGLDLSGGVYGGADLRYADLTSADLTGAALEEGILTGAVFAGCRMRRANLSGALIAEADFRGADLEGADFRAAVGMRGQYGSESWKRPGYRAADFRGACLKGADFRGALLSGALFTGADVQDADFTGAVLHQAVFDPGVADRLDLMDVQFRPPVWQL
ncbi:pentapeptide repeat-containing protein [Paenibacillus sp. FSL W8-0919]|uniref:pentapeptide repeat-containing protein n=1 Tax=Paenibacillus sp. FSL W8-0919 TaxID=2954707 RepID=UPI0030F980A5